MKISTQRHPQYEVEVVDLGSTFSSVVINCGPAGAVWLGDSRADRPWMAESRTPVISPLGAVSVERSRHETKRAAVAWIVVKALGCEWIAYDLIPEEKWEERATALPLPPDLTARLAGSFCDAQKRDLHGLPWLCTRASGHTGRHAAGDGRFIVAVWHQAPGAPASETTGASR